LKTILRFISSIPRREDFRSQSQINFVMIKLCYLKLLKAQVISDIFLLSKIELDSCSIFSCHELECYFRQWCFILAL